MEQACNILIIDDDKISQKFICRGLKDHHSTECVDSGEEGLKAVEKILPDIILLDVEMPGLNGYEVCDRLKQGERTRDIPVVFLSSHGSTTQRMQGYEVGADDYLVKPFSPEDLRAKIAVLTRFREKQGKLENQVEEARQTALTAMFGNSELGQAMLFVERSYYLGGSKGYRALFKK